MATDTVPGIHSDPAPPVDGLLVPETVPVELTEPAEPIRPAEHRRTERRPSKGSSEQHQWLVQQEGPFWDRGRIYEFPPSVTEGTLGRSPSCHWRIDDPSISRLHCALVRRPHRGVYILDLASREGTFLNGERIEGEVLLMDGDHVRLGDRVNLEFVDGPTHRERPGRKHWRRIWWGVATLAAISVTSLIVF